MRYEMFEGDFRIPDPYKQPTLAEGSRYRISDIYHLQIDPDIVTFVGIMPGWRVLTFINKSLYLKKPSLSVKFIKLNN